MHNKQTNLLDTPWDPAMIATLLYCLQSYKFVILIIVSLVFIFYVEYSSSSQLVVI